MKLFESIGQAWEFISRLAHVIIALDDFLLEAKAFWKWLTDKEAVEPEKK